MNDPRPLRCCFDLCQPRGLTPLAARLVWGNSVSLIKQKRQPWPTLAGYQLTGSAYAFETAFPEMSGSGVNKRPISYQGIPGSDSSASGNSPKRSKRNPSCEPSTIDGGQKISGSVSQSQTASPNPNPTIHKREGMPSPEMDRGDIQTKGESERGDHLNIDQQQQRTFKDGG